MPGMKDALAPDIYSPGRGREAFQRIISRFRRPDAADPSATATERSPLPAGTEDAFLPEATTAPMPAAPAPVAPVSSVPEEPAPSPEAPASATEMPEGVLFEPEESVTWQGKGDYHYAYTPGDPDKGRPATITLHGGERGPVPITIREGGRNDRFFQAIMREYQELEQSRGLGQYIPARQYAKERPASTNEVVSTVAQDLVEQPTLPTPTPTTPTAPAQASYGGEMAPGESPLSPEEMAPGESRRSMTFGPPAPEESRRSMTFGPPAPVETPTPTPTPTPVRPVPQTRDDVVLGDFARDLATGGIFDVRDSINEAAQETRGPALDHYRLAISALQDGDYDAAIQHADLMAVADRRRSGVASGIRNTAQNLAALEAQ